MAAYQCPLCGRQMARELVLFLDHAQQHIIDKIKEQHPEWAGRDGICQPCLEYYRKSLSREPVRGNLGPSESQKRFFLGVGMLAAGLGLALLLEWLSLPRAVTLVLFPPFFLAMLGLIQSREKTCALLAARGTRNMDSGEEKIEDPELMLRLKRRGRRIFAFSLISALLLTSLFFFIT